LIVSQISLFEHIKLEKGLIDEEAQQVYIIVKPRKEKLP